MLLAKELEQVYMKCGWVTFAPGYCMTFSFMPFTFIQVATELGDKIKVLKIDTDENPELSTQLQVMCPVKQSLEAMSVSVG